MKGEKVEKFKIFLDIRKFGFLLIVFSLYLTSFLFNTDITAQTAKTAWPMFRQNPQHTGLRDITTDNEPQIVKQKYPPIDTGIGFITDITSSPSIAEDGAIFIGSLAKNFYAIDPEQGIITGTFTTFNSIFSSPAIGKNGNVYVGSWDGTLYELKFNKEDNKFGLLNFFQSGAEDFGHASGVVVDGDTGEPIQNAGVIIGINSGFTDENGEFFIDNIFKGDYTGIIAGGDNCSRDFSISICGFQREQKIGVLTLFSPVTTIDDSGNITVECLEQDPLSFTCSNRNCSFEQTKIEFERITELPVSIADRINLLTLNEDLFVEHGISCSPLIGFNNWIYWGAQNSRFYGWDLDLECIFFKELEGPIVASPAQSADGTVYVITLNGFLHAFNPDFSEVFSEPFKVDGEVKSSPAIGIDGTIYFGSLDNNIYAVKPNGKLKWKFPTGGIVVSSPAIAKNGTIYVGSEDGKLYAIEDRGENNPVSMWEFEAGSEIAGSSGSIGRDGTIYIGIGGEFSKILAVTQDGFLKWCFETENGVTSTPAISENGSIFAGSFDGKLYALEDKGQSEGTIKISGRITNSKTRLPIEGALIEITKVISDDFGCEDPFSANANSEADGSYEVKEIPQGIYNITISHDDFETESEQLSSRLVNDITEKDFELEPSVADDPEIVKVSFKSEIDPDSCLPLRVSFNDTSIVTPPDSPIEYTWNFGDGESSNIKNPEHEYVNTGQFQVELRIQIPGTNVGSSTSSIIKVTEPPCARFKPLEIRIKSGQIVTFEDLSQTSEGEDIIRREWRFNINKPLGKILPRNEIEDTNIVDHIFRGEGEHSVSLFVQQSNGKDDKAFGTVTVVDEL